MPPYRTSKATTSTSTSIGPLALITNNLGHIHHDLIKEMGQNLILEVICESRHLIRAHRMATTCRRRVVVGGGQLGHSTVRPRIGRPNGISHRHERFLASQRAPGFARLLLLLMRLLLLLSKQELCLITLCAHDTSVVGPKTKKKGSPSAFD
jgi:hypothetical protein